MLGDIFTLQIKKKDMIKIGKYSYMTSVSCWTDQMHALPVRIEV